MGLVKENNKSLWKACKKERVPFKALPGKSPEARVATEQLPDGYSLVDHQEFSGSASFAMGLQGVEDGGLCVAYALMTSKDRVYILKFNFRFCPSLYF